MKPWLLLPLLSVCVFPLILGYWPRRRWNASPFLSLRYRGNEGLEESSVGVPCTANDLLPGFGRDYVNGWVHAKSSGDIPTAGLPTYNCTCPYMKAGYFCPHSTLDYPRWDPPAVTDGKCDAVADRLLASEPFPPNTNVLFYGNSHMRQVVESIVCMYNPALMERRACTQSMNPIFFKPSSNEKYKGSYRKVGLTRQCKGFYGEGYHRRWVEEAPCFRHAQAETAFRCDDSQSEHVFKNKAKMHYYFAHQQLNKSVSDALELFGTAASDYDMVFVNCGNYPSMTAERVIETARLFNDVGVPFIWMTTYEGGPTDVSNWDEASRNAFFEANGKQMSINRMVSATQQYRMRAVEKNGDPHFCLPGPPNEMARLLLKTAWAIALESGYV